MPGFTRPLLLFGIAMSLQGCVAAAIPVLAGGAIVGSEAGQGGETGAAPPRAAMARDAEPTTFERASLSAPTEAQGEWQVTGLTEMPGPRSPTAAGLASNGASDFGAFVSYALESAASAPNLLAETPDAAPQLSAVLVAPGLLDGERIACSGNPAGVIIDLDPVEGLFDPDVAHAPQPELAASLVALREAGVNIAWASGRTADHAGTIRRALSLTGLDSAAQDELLLLRYPDDRKQTRRAEFATSHCILAIAGDDRTDFDELYHYLKDPSASVALERLIGDGWFITPLPLEQD